MEGEETEVGRTEKRSRTDTDTDVESTHSMKKEGANKIYFPE